MDLICTVPRPHLLASGPATSAQVISAFLDYILQVCQGLLDSFIKLGKLHWFLYLMLSYKFFHNPSMFTIFTLGVRISCKKLCWKGSMVAEMPYRVSYLVYYDIVWRVNLRKL